VTVANIRDVSPGHMLLVMAGERAYALANVQGTLYAIDNKCAHMGGPLNRGMLNGRELTCPVHGWRWDVSDGRNRWPGVNWRARVVPVRVLPNGDVQLPVI
jgi:nitrite reductase/ring-hydroxylating ferredoxin subunit